MKQFQKKRQIRNMCYSKLTIVVLVLILFLIARGTWGVYQKSRMSLARKNLASVQLEKLQNRDEDLKKELERLESRVGIEEELRIRYSLSKADEKVIVIVDEEPVEPVEIDDSDKGLIGRTMSLFRNLNLVE
jgi:cell division protein FtsB